MIRHLLLCISVATLLMSSGCGYEPDFTYGKSADRSINGTSVFANLLRERGHSVTRKKRLTKRIDRYDTLIWAPDNPQLPPENVVAWLEAWLGESSSRVLIFVGRSYDGKVPFHRGMVKVAPLEEREDWQRELNKVVIEEGTIDGWAAVFGTNEEAFWFEEENDLLINSSKIDGPWAEGVDPEAIELDCDSLLKPMPSYNIDADFPELVYQEDAAYNFDYWSETFRDNELNVTELLTVDERPFAYEISSEDAPDRKLIIISNGSFLLNYPLTNSEHRKLAAKVADEVKGDVVFLESSYRWPKIGGQANDPALQWTWVGQAPMNYIVPHFLFWGVLYCFVFFPNFGRPKRIQFHPPKAFRSHVQAVASILGRSQEKNWAREVVDTWLKRNNKNKS